MCSHLQEILHFLSVDRATLLPQALVGPLPTDQGHTSLDTSCGRLGWQSFLSSVATHRAALYHHPNNPRPWCPHISCSTAWSYFLTSSEISPSSHQVCPNASPRFALNLGIVPFWRLQRHSGRSKRWLEHSSSTSLITFMGHSQAPQLKTKTLT